MHPNFSRWFLAIAFFASGTVHAECTYDESVQLKRILSLAQQVNGRIGAGGHSVRWREGASTFEVIYGGCDHLGHTVTRESPASNALAEPELLIVAMRLAQQQWTADEAAMLRDALREQRYTRSQNDGQIVFNLAVPDYFEFAITQQHAHGVERVSVRWARNF